MEWEEARTMLARSLGAERVADWKEDAALKPPVLSARRRIVQRNVIQCTSCVLHESCCPVPMESPNRMSEYGCAFAVVGEAPAFEEEKLGRPFMGKAGKLLRSAIGGREDGIALDEIGFVYTTACTPKDGGVYRSPKDDEMRACRDNLFAQLEALNAGYVLFAGAKALSAFRTDLTLERAHRQVFVWRGRWVVSAIHHPSAILREPRLKKQWLEDIAWWNEWVAADRGFVNGQRCGKCGGPAFEWDRDGVPWCDTHRDLGRKAAEKSDSYWRGKRVTGQGVLL